MPDAPLLTGIRSARVPGGHASFPTHLTQQGMVSAAPCNMEYSI